MQCTVHKQSGRFRDSQPSLFLAILQSPDMKQDEYLSHILKDYPVSKITQFVMELTFAKGDVKGQEIVHILPHPTPIQVD